MSEHNPKIGRGRALGGEAGGILGKRSGSASIKLILKVSGKSPRLPSRASVC